MHGRPWTEETIGRLKQLWDDENLSAAEIGRRLNISKNAILGKAHRLDLPRRPSPIIRLVEGARRRSRRLQRSSTLPPLLCMQHAALFPAVALENLPTPGPKPHPPRPAGSLPATIAQATLRLRSEPCSWPIGEPGKSGFRFCDAPALRGKPYCAEHAERAYLKIQGRGTAEPA